MKKGLVVFILSLFWCTSVAFAYVIGGSNLGFGGYPEFKDFISFNPSRLDVEIYVNNAKEYVENCNNDVKRVYEARNTAIEKANQAIEDYNRSNR